MAQGAISVRKARSVVNDVLRCYNLGEELRDGWWAIDQSSSRSDPRAQALLAVTADCLEDLRAVMRVASYDVGVHDPKLLSAETIEFAKEVLEIAATVLAELQDYLQPSNVVRLDFRQARPPQQ